MDDHLERLPDHTCSTDGLQTAGRWNSADALASYGAGTGNTCASPTTEMRTMAPRGGISMLDVRSSRGMPPPVAPLLLTAFGRPVFSRRMATVQAAPAKSKSTTSPKAVPGAAPCGAAAPT